MTEHAAIIIVRVWRHGHAEDQAMCPHCFEFWDRHQNEELPSVQVVDAVFGPVPQEVAEAPCPEGFAPECPDW